MEIGAKVEVEVEMKMKVKTKIVCLGDSLTYGYGVVRAETWVSLAAGRTNLELVNRGINGDTTGGMLARFRDETAAYSPDRVFLMGGSNDIFISGSADSAKSNMSALVHQTVALGIVPLIGTPPPLDVETLRQDWANLTDALHAQEIGDDYAKWLRMFADVFNVQLVDFRGAFESVFKSVSDGERRHALYLDGLHPTPEGHRLMADVFCHSLLAGAPPTEN
ncbi:MAG: GDSL-type esterase/lipase family protein [Synergistaceae bacterium]|jgi:lysophospholipase L1-like esterase|nr:GDSL-type esterase/lipase family protein [Synergistaceae bacterium]